MCASNCFAQDVKPFDGMDRANILKMMRRGSLQQLTWPTESSDAWLIKPRRVRMHAWTTHLQPKLSLDANDEPVQDAMPQEIAVSILVSRKLGIPSQCHIPALAQQDCPTLPPQDSTSLLRPVVGLLALGLQFQQALGIAWEYT